MTIIVFLVDTSASMNQRTYMGTTLLDTAKGAVEVFMKIRSRDPNCRWDRYMLLTFDDPPANVKAGWKESHITFMKELKNLEAYGLTTLGPALKHTFDMLNTNRMQSGIDTYGQGRCPFYLEPAVIICLTDGRKMTTVTGASNELNLPMNTSTLQGSELTKEPFRWDQRLYGVVLRLAATPPIEAPVYIPSADDTAIDAMCEVTGGRSYAITSQRTLNQCLESLVQKCQSGVVVNFEKILSDQPLMNGNGTDNEKNVEKRPCSPSNGQVWHNCRRMIYVSRSAQRGSSVGHWPIPESFWPDINKDTLPPRFAHPIIKFSCAACEPVTLENLPFDKYELEPSPLTQYILERRQPNVVWQVFVMNSYKYTDLGYPFGYIKASTNLNSVNLFVMPYNYPALVPILDELIKVHKCKPSQKWKQQFEAYLKTMPAYYALPLKRALQRMNLPPVVPDLIENCLSYSVVSHLKKIKNQAKLEYDRLVASVNQCPLPIPVIKVTSRTHTSILQRPDFNQLLAQHGGDLSSLRQELLTNYDTFTLHADPRRIDTHIYTNPFDINRKELLGNIRRMRVNFLKSATSGDRLQDAENLHNISVQEMGNYQEYLKRLPSPLREIETLPARQHTFGNPFKVNKNIMIDEADEAIAGQPTGRKRTMSESSSSSASRPNKRKPGPLPRDLPARQLMSPARESPPPSPMPDTNSFDSKYSPLSPWSDSQIDQNHISEMNNSNHIDSDVVVSNHVQIDANEMNGDLEIDLTTEDDTPCNTEVVTLANKIDHHRNSDTTKNGLADLENNASVLRLVICEVKKPGKNYTRIFQLLGTLRGSTNIRCLCIQSIINEATRFKKRVLVKQLEEFAITLTNSRRSSKNSLDSKNIVSSVRESGKFYS